MVFKRKIYDKMFEWKELSNGQSALLIEGARRIGKSTIVEDFAKKEYEDYIILDFAKEGKDIKQNFEDNIGDLDTFFRNLFLLKGKVIPEKKSVIIFDEVQLFPLARQAIKYLVQDGRFDYIETGSLISIKKNVKDILIPSEEYKLQMYPMDFEEFLYANNVGKDVVSYLKECFINVESVSDGIHQVIIEKFKEYLISGGLPDSVKEMVLSKNILKVRENQNLTFGYYKDDASQYDDEHSLKIKRIYDMMTSYMLNKVKRIQFKQIENKEDSNLNKYKDEFDYLINSGCAIGVKAVSNPVFPLIESSSKNLIKLYFNDVGILSNILYKHNILAVMGNENAVNLGSVYETVAAMELIAHGHEIYYFDSKKVGEVDFLINDYDNLSILPIEIKSGKNVYEYRAIPKLVNKSGNYKLSKGYVLTNNNVCCKNDDLYIFPIYMLMFI